MKEKTIKVLMVEPHKHPIAVMLDNNHEWTVSAHMDTYCGTVYNR